MFSLEVNKMICLFVSGELLISAKTSFLLFCFWGMNNFHFARKNIVDKCIYVYIHIETYKLGHNGIIF